MGQIFFIHPENPQQRLLTQAAEMIREGAVVVYPTDSCYALGCHMGDKSALERIQRIKQFSKKHLYTLVCQDLSNLGRYAQVSNSAYRLLKSLTPGPYTFVLKATREVPRRLLHEKRKTIGLRVPDHPVLQGLLRELGEPLMNTSLELPGQDFPLNEEQEIQDLVGKQVDLILYSDPCGLDLTTVVDLSEDRPQLLRQGKGPIEDYL